METNGPSAHHETLLPHAKSSSNSQVHPASPYRERILTDHSRLNAFLHKIKIKSDPLCKCQEEVEITVHFLFSCHISTPTVKIATLGYWPPPLAELMKPKSI